MRRESEEWAQIGGVFVSGTMEQVGVKCVEMNGSSLTGGVWGVCVGVSGSSGGVVGRCGKGALIAPLWSPYTG